MLGKTMEKKIINDSTISGRVLAIFEIFSNPDNMAKQAYGKTHCTTI